MDLTGWVVAWVVVTSAAAALAYARMAIGMHDVLGMRIGEPDAEKFYSNQQKVAAKLRRLDVFGITLTVLSSLMAVVILFLWAIEQAGPD